MLKSSVSSMAVYDLRQYRYEGMRWTPSQLIIKSRL